MHERKARMAELADRLRRPARRLRHARRDARDPHVEPARADRQAGRVPRRRRFFAALFDFFDRAVDANFIRGAHRMLAQRAPHGRRGAWRWPSPRRRTRRTSGSTVMPSDRSIGRGRRPVRPAGRRGRRRWPWSSLHHGEIVAERYGVQPGQPVPARRRRRSRPTTPLISWSIAKSMTHAAVGILVGDGRLDPADPAPVPGVGGHGEGGDHAARPAGDALRAAVRRGLRRRRRRPTPSTCCSAPAPADHAAYAAALPLAHPPGHGVELLVGHDEHHLPDPRRPRRRRPSGAGRAGGGDAGVPRPAAVRPGRDARRRPALRRRRHLGRLVVRPRPGPPVRPLRRAVPARRVRRRRARPARRAGSTTPARWSPTTPRPGSATAGTGGSGRTSRARSPPTATRASTSSCSPSTTPCVVHLGKTDAAVRDRLVARLRRHHRRAAVRTEVGVAGSRRTPANRGCDRS